VADAERFVVTVKHSAQLREFNYTALSRNMFGKLQVGTADSSATSQEQERVQHDLCASDSSAVVLSHNGSGAKWASAWPAFTPCLITPASNNGNDYFELETLMRASGLKLDSVQPPTHHHSVRKNGATLMVVIDYQVMR
jgi:hypothetical protein